MKIATGTIKVLPNSPDSTTLELRDGETLLIGRREDAGVVRQLVLPFPEVSGKHAEIRCSEDGWTVVDLGSTNGTAVNGCNLHPGQHHPLRPGDRITISGQYDLLAEPPVDPGAKGSSNREVLKSDDKTQFKIKLINATILVGDIKGFTSLMEQYANEANLVMRAAQGIFQELSKEISKNQGQLEKIAGDAIMAYWHIEDEGPQAQAVLACRAALEMKAVANELANNAQHWPFPENPFALDIAMATGLVAAGALGNSNANPALLGDTANLVFRLEKLIADDRPGDIVVESSTYDLAKGEFYFEGLGEFVVKGRQKPVNVYRLLAPRHKAAI